MPLEKATEAFEAANSGLHSGTGVGTYRYLEKQKDSAWVPKIDAEINTILHHGKYNVTLTYRIEPMKRTKRVIVYDKTAILTTRFGKIAPAGGETEVFDVPSHPSGLVPPERAEFPWDVAQLPTTLEHFRLVRNNVGDDNISVAETPTGYEFIFKVGTNARASLVVSREMGYNLVERKVFIGSVLYQQLLASWKCDEQGVWYVNSLIEELHQRQLARRWELHYDKFDANVAVSDESFTLAALHMPPGSRILDQRPAVTKEDRARWVPNDDAVIEKSLDGMLAQVQSLPASRLPKPTDEHQWILRIGIIVVNVTVVVLVVAYLIYRRKLRRATAA
jgi:hypothetical protein